MNRVRFGKVELLLPERLQHKDHRRQLAHILLNPNPEQTSWDVWFGTAFDLFNSGAGYWWLPPNQWGQPVEARLLPATNTYAVLNRRTELPECYDVFRHAHDAVRLPADDVLAFRLVDYSKPVCWVANDDVDGALRRLALFEQATAACGLNDIVAMFTYDDSSRDNAMQACRQAGARALALARVRLQRDVQASGWEETAKQHLRNEQYYCSLLVQIGEMFGVAAKTSDDGSVQDDVLCAKVPELVAAALQKLKDYETRGRRYL